MANEAGFPHHSVHNENATRMCGRGMRRAAPKGRCFPFTPSRKIAVEGNSNWKLFQVGYPVDTHTDMNFLLRISAVTRRPAFARLILGRWKERSLRSRFPPSLPILQGIYPDRPEDSEIYFDTLAPSAKIKIKKGEKNSFTKSPPKK